MAKILLIETATKVCSIGVAFGGNLIAIRESFEQRSHAELITLFIEDVIREAGIEIQQLDAVAVSMGPGSYTGLRIGVSTAKGICYALDKPLIAIDTLQAMAAGMVSQEKYINAIFCPMIDARRMEVYTALFDVSINKLTDTQALIIDEGTFKNDLEKQQLIFFGDGAAKCRQTLGSNPNAVIIDNFNPSVRFMVNLSQQKYEGAQFENTAYFEPFYLKDFVAAAPKVKGLR